MTAREDGAPGVGVDAQLLFSGRWRCSVKPRMRAVAGATTALVLLTAMNFVNYLDRYILPGGAGAD